MEFYLKGKHLCKVALNSHIDNGLSPERVSENS